MHDWTNSVSRFLPHQTLFAPTMPDLGDFSAWIQVDDEDSLPEYALESSGHTVSCWIPSKAGKEFAVCWGSTHLRYTCSGLVTIDGIECGATLLQYPQDEHEASIMLDSVKTGASTCRSLVFSTVNLTDNDQYLDDGDKDFGEIKLVLKKSEITGSASGMFDDVSNDFDRDLKVHERLKKNLDHCVVLGEETRSHESGVTTKDSRTVATFIFRYRSLDVLQANGIAPLDQTQQRTSAPPEDEQKRALAVKIEAKE
ncbi:hypothetical protein BDN72DRAFT_884319, partial [Pluteus cervinus]